MNKAYYVFKTIWQIFLYTIEVGVVSVGLAILSTQIWGITEPFQMIERIMTAYAVYEVIVFLILTNRNDIEADSALAYGTYLKKILLYFESNDSTLKQDILQNRQRQLSVTTLNSPRNYKRYEQSLRWLEERNATQVQYELIRSEHEKEIASLQWRFSFIYDWSNRFLTEFAEIT